MNTTTNEGRAYEALRLAQVRETTKRPAGPHNSASACAKDAEALFNAGRYVLSVKWSLESLDHSVGIFHADRAKAQDFYDRMDPDADSRKGIR